MRNQISEAKSIEINNRIPTIDENLRMAFVQGGGVDLHDLINGDKLGVSLVCLEDAYGRFIQTRMALFEALACLVWYREESPNAPLEYQAILTSRFYLDYVGLLLYAMAEDIASFIVYFLNLDDALTKFLQDPNTKVELEEKSVSSNAAKVGIYLQKTDPNNRITGAIRILHSNQHWKKALKYRNNWVHEQPPIISGLGYKYARESQVQEVNGERLSIGFGGGSSPEYFVEELFEMMLLAVSAFANALSTLLEIVREKREELGEEFDFENRRISFDLF